ncbi:ricin-type beta-trefoil lectin domain protein [Streptomyces mirabilis]|uniref:ricin-type beta-trefoil lectin domain protein n=1 Tax=Streptomyces mirabilis TaxID=68239 RepID=UPI0036893F76
MKKYAAPQAAALTAALGVGTALPAAAATGTEPPPSAARAAATPTGLRLMPLGDSITWGVGSPSGHSYRGFLRNQLSTEGHALDFVGSGRGGTMSDPDNEGCSGWRIDQITGIADSVLARYRPNVVTLEIGTNDLNGGYRKMAVAFNAGVQAAEGAGWIKPPVSAGGQVRSGIAGKCLDVNGGNNADGTAADIATCNGFDAQQWSAHSDGTLRALGKCLDATGRGTANGTTIEVWDCNGGTNQQWQAYNGGYRNPVSGRCLDDPGASTTDGTHRSAGLLSP